MDHQKRTGTLELIISMAFWFYRDTAWKHPLGRSNIVDVSSKMLQKASEKNTYDHLIVFDILQDWAFSKPFDLIYSSDVFVYFGNLDPIIRSASSYLVHGGIIAFSVEKLEDNSTGYQLFPSGRYAHSHRYIRNCLKLHGLAPIEETDSVIRKQSGGEVKGLLIVAEKGLK